MNVLMIAACPFPAPRGTPTRILRLAEGVSELGHDVHVVAYHLGEHLDQAPFRLHRIADVRGYTRMASGPSYRKLWVDWKLSGKTREILHQEHFDVIHAHHYEGLLAGLLARKGLEIPIVYDAHTLAETELPDYPLVIPRRLTRWLGGRLDRHLPGLADYCVTASHQLAVSLASHSSADGSRVSVVTNGVELDHFSVTRRLTDAGREKRLIYAGNLAPFQGVDLLLEMFTALCEERDDVILLIATNDDTTALERTVERLGLRENVEIRESDYERLPQLLASADVALNPRIRCDGVPQKLLNYMAAGCPVVTMAGSAPHVRHEHSALLVDHPSSTAFLSAVQRLLGDPELAERLGRTARAVAEEKLGWARAAHNAVNVYERLLAR